MDGSEIIEGTVPFAIQGIDATCHTYYRIIGDVSSDAPRLVVLHGGPGTGHEYLLPFGRLWKDFRIPVVFYDQIGCAASTRLPQTAGNESFWQESIFLAELDNLLDALKLRDGPGFHLFGHSWGGRIGPAFAATRPRGLRRLIISSGISSNDTYLAGLRLVISQLPPGARTAIEEAERTGDFDSESAKGAMMTFYRQHLCRAEHFPPAELLPALQHMGEDKTVKTAISGPSPLGSAGSFRDWTCIPRLHQITAPTLVYNGEYDTSHDLTTAPFFEHIPRVRWITFAGAGHMCHLERPEIADKVFKTVGEFLAQEQ